MDKHWYQYRSKDGKVRGLVKAKSEDEVARFAGYPREELLIKPAVWVLEEFVVEDYKSISEKH